MHTLLDRSRLRTLSESGQTLVELLVMMAILMTILVAVTDALISGTHAETNVEHRLNTQSGLRLALTRMRQDVHCAYDVQSVDYNATNQGFTLSLTEFYNTCKAVDSSGSSSSKVQLLWCTVPATAGSTTVYNLYRGNTTCDATSQLIATNLVAPAAGWPTNSLASSATSWNGNIWPDAGTCTTDYLKVLPIDMAVNSDQTGTPNGAYELKDAIALRNSTRCGTTSGGTSGTQARPALSMSVPLAMIVNTTMAASSMVATLSGSNNPSSQITIYRTTAPSASAPSTCTGGSWTTVGTANVTADGNFTPSGGGFTPTAVGNYWWYASFAADTNDKAANTPCPSAVETIVAASKSSPTLTISAPAVGTTGIAIQASSISVTISGSLGASGPITIYAYLGASNPASCPGGAGWTTVGTLTPSGDGTYNPSVGIASPATGNYWWYASYAGDSTNNSKTTACSSLMTKTAVAAFSGSVTSATMLDTDHDGKVDEIDVLFSVPVSCTASCTDGWTVSNIPSGGTLSSVTTSSNTAKLMITEGPGAADTSVGTLTVSLAAPGGIKDAAGHYASFASTIPVDGAGAGAHEPRLAPERRYRRQRQDGGGRQAGAHLQRSRHRTDFQPRSCREPWEQRQRVTLNIVGFTTTADTGSSGYVSSKSTNVTSTGAAALSAGNTTVTITLGAIGGTGTAATSSGTLVFNQTGTTLKDAAGNTASPDPHHCVDLQALLGAKRPRTSRPRRSRVGG